MKLEERDTCRSMRALLNQVFLEPVDDLRVGALERVLDLRIRQIRSSTKACHHIHSQLSPIGQHDDSAVP